ncbi:MAG: shikimate dehydrogenase [Solirubrobacteraceae bacterium]|nr:shikimate dehydrogenase [Solirubrobacteraceae bacterium]
MSDEARPASVADPDRAWRLGVLGWPVAHSRSPAMQSAALADLGLGHWTYQRLPVPPDEIDGTLAALADAGFAGANVTIPHKGAARRACDVLTDAAREIGAVNTITVLEDGALHGDNTDAPGLLDAIGVPLDGRTALVLGAGGSARACAWALRRAGCSRVAVWNRTAARARGLADDLDVDVADAWFAADVVVNSTAVGLHDPAETFVALPVPEGRIGEHGTVVDLVYRPEGTRLLAVAERAGCVTVDGLAVLVGQGARSLERWTGRTAPRTVMADAARRG